MKNSLDRSEHYCTPRREAYAWLLEKCVYCGMGLLVATFIVYLAGILEPAVPIVRLPEYWGMSAAEYVQATGIDGGWSWTTRLHQGDLLNYLGFAFMSLVTVFCYLRVLPFFWRDRDCPLGIIAVLEVILLLLAASGWFF